MAHDTPLDYSNLVLYEIYSDLLDHRIRAQ